jgi:hypothetical protein
MLIFLVFTSPNAPLVSQVDRQLPLSPPFSNYSALFVLPKDLSPSFSTKSELFRQNTPALPPTRQLATSPLPPRRPLQLLSFHIFHRPLELSPFVSHLSKKHPGGWGATCVPSVPLRPPLLTAQHSSLVARRSPCNSLPSPRGHRAGATEHGSQNTGHEPFVPCLPINPLHYSFRGAP